MEIGSKELNPVRVGDGAGESVKNITWIHKKIRNSLQVKQLPDNVLKNLEKLSLRIWKISRLSNCLKQNFIKAFSWQFVKIFWIAVFDSVRTFPRLTLPRGQFPERTLPRLEISPLRHFPDRTFPWPHVLVRFFFSNHFLFVCTRIY